MLSLDLALDIAQFVALLVVSGANGVIAYSVFKLQKDRNTPKLVVYVELVEEDDRDYYGLYVRNVGLVPALSVHILADIEVWRCGRPVKSSFHEKYVAFHGSHITLNSQDHRMYELPWLEGCSLIVTAVATCNNGPSDAMRSALGDDPLAIREVALRKRRQKAIKQFKSRTSSRTQGPRAPVIMLGLESMNDREDLLGDKTEDPK